MQPAHNVRLPTLNQLILRERDQRSAVFELFGGSPATEDPSTWLLLLLNEFIYRLVREEPLAVGCQLDRPLLLDLGQVQGILLLNEIVLKTFVVTCRSLKVIIRLSSDKVSSLRLLLLIVVVSVI